MQNIRSWERENESLIAQLLDRMRCFTFDSDTDKMATELVGRSRGVLKNPNVMSLLQLRAVSLLNEYFDAKGANEYPVSVDTLPAMQAALENVAQQLQSPEFMWPSDGSVESTRLCRQQIWCLISLANLRYESGNPSDARSALSIAKIGLQHLDTEKSPCHGTRYHLCHIEGLLQRDEGNLNEALLSFSRAMRHGRKRMEDVRREKTSKYEVEVRYFRICQARTLAFGLAESDFLRGAFLRAESLFTSALPILEEISTANAGASRWKTLVQLYLLQCQALTTDFDDRNAEAVLSQIADEITKIRETLRHLKVHHEYCRLSTVFRMWTLLRMEQVKRDKDRSFPMLANLSPSIEAELELLRDEPGKWSNGPIGRLIKRVRCEVLIRTRSTKASDVLEEYEGEMKSINISQTEFRLLRAENLILARQERNAKAILEAILLRRELSVRQRIWAKVLRARIARNQSLDVELARDDIRETVSSAYLRAQIQFVKGNVLSRFEARMPFENDGDLNIDVNVIAIENATVLSALMKYPTDSVTGIAAKLGKSERWLYAVKKRIREDPNLRQLLPAEISR